MAAGNDLKVGEAGKVSRSTEQDSILHWVDWRYGMMDLLEIEHALEQRNCILVGDSEMVRIPKIPGRIYIKKPPRGLWDVEYIYEKWYDKEKKQNRNRKVKIGLTAAEFPNGMYPLPRYYDFFDVSTGELKAQKPKISVEELTTEYGDTEEGAAQERKQELETEGHEMEPFTGESDELIEESELIEAAFEAEEEKQEEPRTEIQEAITDEPEGGDEEAEPAENDANEAISKPESLRAASQTINQEKPSAQSKSDMLDEILKIYKEDMAKAKKALAQSDKEKRKMAEEMMRVLGSTGMAKRMALDSDARTSGMDFMSGTETDQEYEQIKWVKDRFFILRSIVQEMQETIRTLAKKQPDGLINTYKARSMNKILSEVRQREEKIGMADLLEMIQEPHEEEQNGKTVTVGTTYSDAEIILDHYYAVMFHTIGNERLYEK